MRLERVASRGTSGFLMISDRLPTSPAPSFLRDGGEVGALVAAYDWSTTPLGPIGSWPSHMTVALGFILRSHVPIVSLWGEVGTMIYNDAYSVFAGGRHPGQLGLGVRDGWPEVAEFNDNVMKVVLAGGTLAYKDQELTLNRHGAPEQVWMDLDYSPALDDRGVPCGVIAIVTETTERVRAERWLQGEQDRLRRMFQQAPSFIALLAGPEHRIELANPGFMRLIGEREVVGRTIAEALPDAVEQGYLELLNRVFNTGEAFAANGAKYAVQANPEEPADERYVDFVYQPLKDQAGETVGIFVEGSDVTERTLVENQMKAGEARSRQILDSATDYAIIASDLEGKVTRWNRGAENILGWTEADMLGKPATLFFTPEDREAGVPEAEMQGALKDGSVADERWHMRKSGDRFWAMGQMTPLLDEQRAVAGFVKVLRDRTDEHMAAQALARTADQLDRAQEAGGVGVFTLDLATNLITGSTAFCRIFGLEVCDSVPASEIETLIVPEDAGKASNEARRSAGDADRTVEYRVRRADTGEERVLSRRAEFERDDAGRPTAMVGVIQDVTEQRRVQAALEQSEAQFRSLAQGLPNQIWTAQPDGGLDWFNRQVVAYSGRNERDLVGEGWGEIVHSEDLTAAAARWGHSVATGEIYEAEFRIRRADGDYRWHLVRALPIRGADGLISHWVGSNTDIHDQKSVEAANARDRDRLWTMSQDLMLVCDFEGIITAVNPSATRLLGWEVGEMAGRSLAEFTHPDDLASTAQEVGKLEQGATTLAFENRYRCRDGTYRLLDWTAVPDAGRIHAVGRDITEERAIARDQERIWSVSPVLKVVASGSGEILKVNPAWSSCLGWSTARTVQHRFDEFLSGDEASRTTLLNDIVGPTPPSERQVDMRAADDAVRQVVWNFVRDTNTIYGFGRDVTEQRATEDALRQSQKMEAVGQLTGGIAHDFNNLLQGITGSLDLVQKRIGEGRISEIDRFMTGAMTSANRAAALTHRLLAFSRRQPLAPRAVRANPLVASMEDLIRRTMGERIELELALAGGLWLTQCDPNQLESAILNLVINARDAMPDGGRLTIETCNAHLDSIYAASQRDVRPGQYVCICVTDTGTGMDARTIAKAFDPFFTTKPIGQGTGLGLSMIYGFARQSEGYAKIYSEIGKGTTIKLYLPRHIGEAEEHDGPLSLSDAHGAEEGETVLVVEDEDVVRGLIVSVLEDLGYRTLEASDGPKGLEILQSKRRIDLLITDIGLPGLNGRQVADAGRELRANLKVLFMTGYAENAALASGFLEHGMTMITKPFAMEALATRIRDILGDD